jgi:hypothetical protein
MRAVWKMEVRRADMASVGLKKVSVLVSWAMFVYIRPGQRRWSFAVFVGEEWDSS